MAESKPPEFRFNVDDQEEPDEFYHEEMKDLRVEKLSQRITLISILLPCLIAVEQNATRKGKARALAYADGIGGLCHYLGNHRFNGVG